MTTNLINISTKNSIIFGNNKRLKVLLSIQNLSNICHSNQTPICVFNRFIFQSISSKSNLNANRWIRKSNFVSIHSTMRSMSQSLDTTYERIADQTLEHLYEEFEAIVEEMAEKDTDVSLSVCDSIGNP